MFSDRQKLYLLSLTETVRSFPTAPHAESYDEPMRKAIATYLAILVDRQADYSSNGCIWEPGGEFIKSTFTRQAIPFVMDYVELAPFGRFWFACRCT